MKRIAALALFAAVAGPALADEFPPRKPGLWESKTLDASGKESVVRQCIDEKTDGLARFAAAGQNCKNNTVTKTGDGYQAVAQCEMSGMTARGESKITGDFQSALKVETVTTMSNVPGLKEPLTVKVTIETKYVGDCEAGQKPGDIVLPDGKVMKTPGVQ